MHYEKFAIDKQQPVSVAATADTSGAAGSETAAAEAAEAASELAAQEKKKLLKKDYEIDVGELLDRVDDSESDECAGDERTEWERYEDCKQVSVNEDLLADCSSH